MTRHTLGEHQPGLAAETQPWLNPAMSRVVAALLLMIILPWCWCGADGPPRPPRSTAQMPDFDTNIAAEDASK